MIISPRPDSLAMDLIRGKLPAAGGGTDQPRAKYGIPLRRVACSFPSNAVLQRLPGDHPQFKPSRGIRTVGRPPGQRHERRLEDQSNGPLAVSVEPQ